MIEPSFIVKLLSKKRFSLHDEKALQKEIHSFLLTSLACKIDREFRLDDDNIIDFLIDDRIGIEVKIKGSKRALYNQCVRYCDFKVIQSLLLATNVSIGFPEEINGKDCYVLNLSKAWL